MLVQDIPSVSSRGHVDSTSDFVVDSTYYSNFYQPPLHPYYSNLYNYTPYQMAMTADPTSTGDLNAIGGAPIKNTFRSIPAAYVQAQQGNQWQVKEGKTTKCLIKEHLSSALFLCVLIFCLNNCGLLYIVCIMWRLFSSFNTYRSSWLASFGLWYFFLGEVSKRSPIFRY